MSTNTIKILITVVAGIGLLIVTVAAVRDYSGGDSGAAGNVDIELDIQDEKYKNVLALLEDKTEFFKILGNYRKELQSAN